MSKKIKELKHEVTISGGFPGKYVYGGGTSYYMTGGKIHFSINGGDDDDFKNFHVTPDVLTGTNVGIWFKGDKWSNNNLKNLPPSKAPAWEAWWEDNEDNVKKAAKDFWQKVQAD
jgi:hypothetical protein